MLVVSPFDKGSMGAIEKAIRNSDLGLNPTQRRRGHPARLPAAHRGAPQGAGRRSSTWPRTARSRSATCAGTARHELDALAKDGDISEDELVAERRRSSTASPTPREADIDQALEHKEHELLEV